ncbi:fimbrial biogenesis chaperone [Serratia marcescens]|uniref:fimbrial biogenesis chaperone n=1 Tax=Serratia marcescens TaxID=615 RepID=UPI00217C2E78|nr:molecular chaperone [Serratia marcescens]CAI0793135.1 Chaperone protein faeE precursor [Serratia marcescens]CAI2427031.1 Chaperone protein faeE precursor [Serratia marcescens]
MMRKKYLTMGCALLLALAAMGAQAGIIASATRVIFREGDTEKTLMLLNTNGYPIVAQTWVDNGDVNAAPELSRAPFVTLPSVFALPPAALKGLRILFAGAALPTDRESVFWLNLYEIPPSQPTTPPLASRVTLAMNTQMKIFYRPKALKGNAENAAEAVSFSLQKSPGGYLLRCHNRSAFYLSFARISIHIGKRDYPVRQESDMMTAPFSMRDYHLDGVAAPTLPSQITVQATLINDQGQQIVKSYTANP